jgi:hypothetical protein
MLIVKPLCLMCSTPEKPKNEYAEINEALVEKQDGHGDHDDIGEIFVH